MYETKNRDSVPWAVRNPWEAVGLLSVFGFEGGGWKVDSRWGGTPAGRLLGEC